jgi:hypothetical protein
LTWDEMSLRLDTDSDVATARVLVAMANKSSAADTVEHLSSSSALGAQTDEAVDAVCDPELLSPARCGG